MAYMIRQKTADQGGQAKTTSVRFPPRDMAIVLEGARVLGVRSSEIIRQGAVWRAKKAIRKSI